MKENETKRIVVESSDTAGLLAALSSAGEFKTVIIELALNGTYAVQRICPSSGDALPSIPAGCLVVLEGNGSTLARTGSCAPACRFFSVFGKLEVRNLKLSNGKLKGAFGACIAVAKHGQIVMQGCEVINCEVAGHSGLSGGENGGGGGGGGQGACGGAIFSAGGHVFLYKCTFRNNCAIGGNGGDANPHHGRFVGEGGTGGGRAGGNGGAAGNSGVNAQDPFKLENCAGQEKGMAMFQAAFGGGGGGSSGVVGSNGGNGAWGGGGGGAGAKTLGGFDSTGEPGKGGWGGGNGGVPGASSGSAGGGGGAFGGAVCAMHGGSLVVRSCVIQQNKCTGGRGGRHPWGWPAGHVGQSFGGGIFVWKLDPIAIEIDGLDTKNIAYNVASLEQNVFDFNKVSEAHIAPLLISKNRSLVDCFSQLTVRCVRVPSESEDDFDTSQENEWEADQKRRAHARSSSLPPNLSEEIGQNPADKPDTSPRSPCGPQDDSETLTRSASIRKEQGKPAPTRTIHLPVHLVENILEYYVGWELPEEPC